MREGGKRCGSVNTTAQEHQVHFWSLQIELLYQHITDILYHLHLTSANGKRASTMMKKCSAGTLVAPLFLK